MPVKRTAGLALVGLGLSLGCATPYTLYMKDGDVVEALDEPDFDEDTGFYSFEDDAGRTVRVNKDEVVRMEER